MMKNLTLKTPGDLEGPETEAEDHAEETRRAVAQAGHEEHPDEYEASDGRRHAAGMK